MRKIIYSTAVMVFAFFAASCQQENLEPVVGGNTVTYTVQMPGSIQTKAINAEDYILNYEVYRAGEVSNPKASAVYEGTADFNGGTANFELEFVKNQSFVVLFWAQTNELQSKLGTENQMFDIDDLRNVQLVNCGTSNNANAAVFAGKDEVENCVSINNGGNVSLARPISQLNIYTTKESLEFGQGISLSNSYVKVSGLYKAYNVAEGTAVVTQTTTSCEYDFANVPATGVADQYAYVAMNYVGFAAQSGTNVNVDFKIKIGEDADEISHHVANVPIKPNYKTNIVGNLITGSSKYDVTLGDNWSGEETIRTGVRIGDNTYATLAEAYAVAQDGNELVVVGSILLSEKFIIEKNITLNLNGNEITTTYDATSAKHLYAFEVKADSEVVIKNGTIKSRGIYNYGTLTLENGAVIDACDANGGYAIYNFGTFVMNDGSEVKTSYEDDNLVDQGGYDATTIRNENGGKVTINGGKVNNISDFTFAIDNQNGGEVVVNGGEITSIHSTVSNYGTLTINGGSFTCNGIEGITAHALVAWGGSTTTINGGIFDGKDNYNGFNVDAVAGATVYIKGGEFRPVHSGSLYGDGTITVSGGVFFDEIASSRLAEGCTLEQLQDGNWKVEGKGWYQDAQGNYHIEGAKGWLWMADQNDTFFRNKTIYLDNDIDFSGVDMRVAKMFTPEYSATFDGQDHTISNVWMSSGYDQNNQALFDGLMTVKNLKVVNSHVYGMSQVGIIGANIFGNIENCHVKGCRSYGYVHHVGGIVGLHSWGEIKNCSVENTKIECYYYGAVGAIAGAMNEVSRKITGCEVKGCQLIKEGPEGVYPDWDPCFGIAVGYAYAPGTYVFNVEVENNTIKGVASEQMYGEVAAGSTITVNGLQQ